MNRDHSCHLKICNRGYLRDLVITALFPSLSRLQPCGQTRGCSPRYVLAGNKSQRVSLPSHSRGGRRMSIQLDQIAEKAKSK
jgi:hypothetical protein